MNSYEYVCQIEEILDDALNRLTPEAYKRLLDNIVMMCEEKMED